MHIEGRFQPRVYIGFLCIYTCFLIVGILGNLATVVVILSNKAMRSPTNIYLTNLALADIFTLSLSKNQFLFAFLLLFAFHATLALNKIYNGLCECFKYFPLMYL